MKTISIRRATQKDAKPMADLLAKCQWFTYETLYPKEYIKNLISQYYNVQRIKDEIISISRDWHGYFIAETNKKIVGVIGGGMTDVSVGEVYVFYIDPSFRENGVGTRLLEFFTKHQKFTYGAQEQWVAVAKGNHLGIPFYEAKGFIFQHEELTYGTVEKDQDISLKYKRRI